MIDDPRHRLAICVVAGAGLAVLVGAQLAAGQFIFAIAVLLVPAAIVLERWIPAGAIGLLLGGLLLGNVVGNRGFAQLTPSPSLPLYPAEIGLAAGLLWLLASGARARRVPFCPDATGWAVLAWIILGSLRLPFDLAANGIDAARDYALVYYAGFFFVARHAAGRESVRTSLHHAWVFCLLALCSVYPVYVYFEPQILDRFTLNGLPVIAIKSDLAGTFAAAGAMYAAARWRAARQWRWSLLLLATLGLALYIVTRAAFVGMLVTAACFMSGVRLKLARTLAVLLLLGLLASAGQVALGDRSWRETRMYDVYEHAASIVDVTGRGTYEGEASRDTGDNTQFRLVWWRLLIDRTAKENLLTGAGYGADISSEFARDYLGIGAGDFTARSPHNVILTVFARSGLTGLLPFLVMMAAIAREQWRGRQRLLRAGAEPHLRSAVPDVAMGCAATVILVSACFGVVLEGPMGAVVFWTLLGVALSRTEAADAAGDSPTEAPEGDVQSWQAAGEAPNRSAAPGPC